LASPAVDRCSRLVAQAGRGQHRGDCEDVLRLGPVVLQFDVYRRTNVAADA
jgi:hypothetical protein